MDNELGSPSDYPIWQGKSRQSLIDTLDGWRIGNKVLVDNKCYDSAYVFTRLVHSALKTSQMEGIITPQELKNLSDHYRLDVWLHN